MVDRDALWSVLDNRSGYPYDAKGQRNTSGTFQKR